MLAGSLALLAGCGDDHAGAQLVNGAAYSFRTPAGWSLTRSAGGVRASAGKGSAALAGVTPLPLLHVYRPALWTKVVRELDGASAAIARRQHGVVKGAEDVTIAGTRGRRYTVAYELGGKQLVEELAFVLRGKTEYLLLCRYERGTSRDACRLLESSFRLTQAPRS